MKTTIQIATLSILMIATLAAPQAAASDPYPSSTYWMPNILHQQVHETATTRTTYTVSTLCMGVSVNTWCPGSYVVHTQTDTQQKATGQWTRRDTHYEAGRDHTVQLGTTGVRTYDVTYAADGSIATISCYNVQAGIPNTTCGTPPRALEGTCRHWWGSENTSPHGFTGDC